MSVHTSLARYRTLPVYEFAAPIPEALSPQLKALRAAAPPPPPPPPAAEAAWRIWLNDYEQTEADYVEHFGRFLEQVDTTRVRELIIGGWADMIQTSADLPIRLLVEAADRFPELRLIALADVNSDECEISWIPQGDIAPLLRAFPELEVLEVRGGAGMTFQAGDGLELEPVRHEALRVLRLESGGLPSGPVAAVSACDLPALEHLELWLGDEDYGATWEMPDLAEILSGERLPSLRHLGLQNSTRQDEIAAAVASAPVVARLESLSLAMGALTDEGAEALLAGQPLTHLDWLGLHHHYLSDEMMDRVRAALPDVEVDLSDRQDDDGEWLYVEVGE
ncbi:leucine-rich repeat domain-containing protein [Actinomadura craniellae]|uniref:Leucine-rich repeat domain-containing protein n=1 Tax=Actinomadura craniellae TaxID=2231787 RepID=A0A365GVT1_9ACTN|nr:STM4015 family protein [Actinomadura craniellae]RAY10884.1 leucine-rich repeat domain-containing protein [Actinomadura craniellae]